MKKLISSPEELFGRVILLFILINLFVFLPAPVHSGDAGTLAGKPFSDPSHIAPMPEEWINKSIKYKTTAGEADLVISLNQQLHHFMLPLIQKYAKENNLIINISKGTCGRSGGMLNRKEVDIGSFCCPPGKVDRLPGLRFHTLGIMPLAILVNTENPVEGITLEQARKIFQGELNNWNKLGGTDEPIRTYGALHCKKRPGHWRLLLANEDLFSPRLMEVGELDDSIAAVAGDPQSISYETLLSVERYQGKDKVKALKIDGRHPDELDHILQGNYPLYRTFVFTTWESKQLENPHALKLTYFLNEQIEQLGSQYDIIPASKLRKAGWKFKGQELIGESK